VTRPQEAERPFAYSGKSSRKGQPAGAPNPEPDAYWLRLKPAPDKPATEHTGWINISDLLDGMLRADAVPTNDRMWSRQENATQVARVEGDFVAMISAAGRFETLVDRHAC
jgi:hypothetical protein